MTFHSAPVHKVTFEIGGTVPGSEYDTFLIGGNATLDGTLLVDLIDGFMPEVGEVFTLMTFDSRVGEFGNVAAAGDLGGLELEATYTDTNVLLSFAAVELPGDANGDGVVDGLDYIIWAEHFGEMDPPDALDGPADGDFNNDAVVDGNDYLIWAANFGSGGAVNVVPEPAGWLLLVTADAWHRYWSSWGTRRQVAAKTRGEGHFFSGDLRALGTICPGASPR